MRKIKPVVDIPALLESTMDLESGHPVDGILRQHNIPARHSAYDVVKRYKKNLDYYQMSVDSIYVDRWRKAVKKLEPVVKAIEDNLELIDSSKEVG